MAAAAGGRCQGQPEEQEKHPETDFGQLSVGKGHAQLPEK